MKGRIMKIVLNQEDVEKACRAHAEKLHPKNGPLDGWDFEASITLSAGLQVDGGLQVTFIDITDPEK
jgi:hypothetical protein